MVRKGLEVGARIDQLTLEQLREISPAFGEDVRLVFNASSAVAARSVIGGTAPTAVRDQIAVAKSLLKQTVHHDDEYHWPVHHVEQTAG
jgi:argininosuccinate lyase